MRCSLLRFPPLLVAFLLGVTSYSLGSPTERKQHITSLSSRHEPVQSVDISVQGRESENSLHPIMERGAPDGSNRSIRRRRDISAPSNHPSPALLQRHNHIMDHLRLHSSDSPLAKRSLASDLTVMGFRLIWDHADVIVSSTLAYYRTTEYYRNMTILAGGEFEFGPTTQNFMITYGVFRLTFGIWANAVTGIIGEIAPNGIGQFVQEFAEAMLALTAGVVIGTYRVLAWSVTTAIWITMVAVENADVRDLVNGL